MNRSGAATLVWADDVGRELRASGPPYGVRPAVAVERDVALPAEPETAAPERQAAVFHGWGPLAEPAGSALREDLQKSAWSLAGVAVTSRAGVSRPAADHPFSRVQAVLSEPALIAEQVPNEVAAEAEEPARTLVRVPACSQ